MPYPIQENNGSYSIFPKKKQQQFPGIKLGNYVKRTTTSTSSRSTRAAKLAVSQIGVKEATGNNDGQQVEKYQYNSKGLKGAPWCSSFFNWCYNPRHIKGKNVLGMNDADVPSSQAVLRKAKEEGCFVQASSISTYVPHVGDGIVWRSDKDHAKGHIGIVVEVRKDGSFVTVQGNNHDAVERVEYKSVQDAYFIGRTSSGGYAQTLQGFIDMEKYNNKHNLASTFEAPYENHDNPNAEYNLMA